MLLPLIFGAITGLALGFTGGGGTLLALPLLIHGLGLSAHDAAVVSLVAVGAMALVGALARLRAHQLQLHLGLLFAAAGMAGAPFGAWLAPRLPPAAIGVGFVILMLAAAVRLWRRAHGPLPTDSQPLPAAALLRDPACGDESGGRLRLDGRCLRRLIPLGLATGVVSGLFGVGGGFVVVPSLVLIAGCDIRQATATSLLVVALVSGSGAATALALGARIDPVLTALFIVGGAAGVEAGARLGTRLPVVVVQRAFAVVLLMVAAVMLVDVFNPGVMR